MNGLVSDISREKKTVEYVVLQKMMLRGEEGKWKIWGTIEESKVEDVLGDDALVATQVLSK